MANLTSSLPYTTGVPNATIDAINAAIDEINLAGGDAMGDRVPTGTTVNSVLSDVAAGAVTITAAKDTESVTLGFTPDSVVVSSTLEAAGNLYAVAISGTTTGLVTFTRNTSTGAGTIYYFAVASD
jgi:hypothetical protein